MFFLLISFLFSGCERSFDINERLIVQGVGIDSTEDGFEITVQALNTDTYSGIGGAKVPETLVKNYFLTGKTVADALSKLTLTAGSRPLFTHTRIVLIGFEQAKRGLNEVIDFFTRDSNCHSGLFTAVCSKTARETLVSNENKESVPAVEIENAVETAGKSAAAQSVHIYELIKMFREKTTAAYLPVVSVPSGKNGENNVIIEKTAVFKGDRLFCCISSEDTKYLSVFTNSVKDGSYSLENSAFSNASFDFYSSKSRTDVFVDENGVINFDVKLRIVFDCIEIPDSQNGEEEKNRLSSLQKALEKELSERTERFLYKMSLQGTDCMRLGRILLNKKQNVYKLCEKDWENTLKNVKITVVSRVTLRRTGQQGN